MKRNIKFNPVVTKDVKNTTLLSATPVMAGRKLNNLPPETPFLASRQLPIGDKTPVIKGFRMAGKRIDIFSKLKPPENEDSKPQD